ncbi:ribosomal biogenesis factor-like [Penaeus vannamei]
MGKNKVHSKQPIKSGNPIYKRAGALPAKAKAKTKPVKTNLRKLKIKNEETIKSLDKKVDSFRQAVSDSQKKPKERPPRPTPEDPPEVNMEEAAEELSKL